MLWLLELEMERKAGPGILLKRNKPPRTYLQKTMNAADPKHKTFKRSLIRLNELV